MKTKVWKRILASVLAGIMLLSLAGCAEKEPEKEKVVIQPMEEEVVHSLSFDFIGGNDVMPIGGYYGPAASFEAGDGRKAPDHYTDEFFSKIADSGVNLLLYPNADYEGAKDYVIKELELAEKYQLGVYVYDGKICEQATEGMSVEALDIRLTEYCDYPAFCGVYVVDEPQPSWADSTYDHKKTSRFAETYQKLRELGIVASSNLGPQKSGGDGEYATYEKFVEEYITLCSPMYLCFDYYVWDGDTSTEGYFRNMSIIREYAEKYEIPWWSFIQAGSHWNDAGILMDTPDLYPNEGQFNWNVSTALACGAKGLSYFPLIQPWKFSWALSEEFDFQRNGILGAYGNKTQWWYYAQNVNEHIRAVDSVLMNSVNKGVIVSGNQANIDTKHWEFKIEGTSWRELASVDGNAIIGCFNYKGKTALYVANYEYEFAQKITLNLQDTYKMSVTKNADTTNIETNTLVLDMTAGEGALIVFE